MEAFKPGTGPADSYWVIGMDELGAGATGEAISPQANKAITQRRRRPVLTDLPFEVRDGRLRKRPPILLYRPRTAYLCSAPLGPDSDQARQKICVTKSRTSSTKSSRP